MIEEDVVPVFCCENFDDAHGDKCDNITCDCDCHNQETLGDKS